MVVEITHNGDIVNEWDVLGESLWTRFSRDTDYRKVQTTKPHKSHPNFLFILDGEYWVLRHAQRDAISLKNPDKKINIQVQRPHDGLEYEDRIYFTTVDGHIVAADKTTSEIVQIVNLNEFSDSDRPLGWCRGIHIIDKDTIIIGFSRLRPTAIMESVQWAKRKLKNALNIENDDSLPTRLCCYDLAKNIVLWEIDLENSGMNAIFSIHELS
jgi:hypothetical protein